MTDQDRPAIQAIAFDLMDTMVHDPWREGLRAAFGDRLEAAMSDRDPTSWPRFESGEITEAEFWAVHAEFSPDPAACREVRIADTTWIAGMRELLRDVRAADVITLIASNYPTWIEDIEHTVIANVADHLVVSCRIGERKPDAAFYTQVAATAGVPTDAITFVDDRAKNVEGAEATGMVGILFETADQVRADLENIGLTLPRRAPERR